MIFDSLGDRIKFYEKSGISEHFLPMVPVVARLDGVSFHNYTKGCERPYDISLSQSMQHTMVELVKETNAIVGYTQSDEITLVLYAEDHKSQIYFDGKVQKIISVLASKCTNFFNQDYKHKDNLDADFDCRAFSVPNKWEACNALIWREQDATRNSIQMAARSVYSHKECHEKNRSELQEMLHQKGINWNNYPEFFKRGSFLLKRINDEKREYTTNVPILTKIANLPEFIFDNAEPTMTVQ